MGYRKSSKDYRIYILGSRQIKVSRDVTYEEDIVVKKGRGSDMEIDDDEEMRSSPPPNIKREFEEMNKPISPIDLVELDDAPIDMSLSRKRPKWVQQILLKLCMEQMGALDNTRPDCCQRVLSERGSRL